MGTREVERKDDIQAVVHQENSFRPPAGLLERLGHLEDGPSADAMAPEMKSDPLAPRLNGAPGLGEEAGPAEDGVVGDEVEAGDHSKLICVVMAWPLSQGPTGIRRPPAG